MRRRKFLMGSAAALSLAGCSSQPQFLTYDGPEVTFVVVQKSQRRMHLLHNDSILESYDIQLGFAPVGHKQFEGDGKTPEGVYRVDRRNPESRFHLSLGISYPNVNDVAAAAAMGKSPGGDIFIHGQENRSKPRSDDWTWGCIAVKNEEMERIYAMVRTGTLVALNP